MTDCDHEFDPGDLEMAECHGGVVVCPCGERERWYSSFKLANLGLPNPCLIVHGCLSLA